MKNNILRLLPILYLFFLAFSACQKADQVTEGKPNIILILADDMGYSDLGCTGSEISTPNLDKMAKNGALFTNFYNTSRCCPSRTSLLTGQYQWDAGMGHMDTDNSAIPEYQGYINYKSMTIAEVLKQNGYQTFMSGKWHVGSKERYMWPDHRGFDQFYGTPSGGGIYFYPSKFYDRPVYWNGEQVHPDTIWYSTDGFTDYAIDYIENRREVEKPFFMYVAYVAPHYPLQAKKEDIDKYRNMYLVGYDSIRQARFAKQQQLGLVPKGRQPTDPIYPNWESIENKEEEAMKMAVYAAQVDCMDQNIGRIMQSLKKEGIDNNTVVFFLTDNGACPVGWNKTPEAEIGTSNYNGGYGLWYNVSNTPYRMHKRQEHEGGIITPLVVHWPAGIQNPGEVISEAAHINDFMPTCLELAGATYPEKNKDKTLDPLDGTSFLPQLNGGVTNKNRYYFWEHEGNKAVRKGDWKLVALHKGDWELYNLKSDPFEQYNMIADKKELAEALKKKYEKWAQEHGVSAWPL